jgi:polyisoprenoid-binding protein YceI
MSAAVDTGQRTLPAGTWNLDPVHSQVGFAVDYIIGTFRGSFSPVEAKLEVGEDGEAGLTGSAPVTGVKVQDENMSAHLQSPEFFDAERTPQITFASTRIHRSGDEVTIDGDLTIRGTTLPVQAKGRLTEPADDPYGSVRFGLQLEATVDRTTYGLNWNNPLPNGKPALGNAVTLTADLVLVKA